MPPPLFTLAFFYRDDCQRCATVRPQVEALARETQLTLVPILATDRTMGPLISRYEITEIPTVLLLRDGKLAVESPGTHLAKKAILSHLERHSPDHVKADRRKAVP